MKTVYISLFALFFSISHPVMAGTDASLTSFEANHEVKIVVEYIMRYHPNPFHITPRHEFFFEVDQLLKRTGEITMAQQYFDLARLSSLVFDTHTQFHIQKDTPAFASTFPLRFKIFSEGLYVIAGNEHYSDIVGKKVISISGQDPAEVIDKLADYSPADNQPRKKVYAESYLYWPETYHIFGLKTPVGTIELVLEDQKGNRITRELSATWQKGPADFSWDSLNPFLPKSLLTVHDVLNTDVPFYLRRINDNYWFRFLDSEREYLYLQINQQFAKDEKEGKLPIEFHLDWSRALWESKAKVLIIDLRNNPGGTINWGNPLSGILSDMYFEHPTLEGIALLFGTDTVSAGTIIVAQLEEGVKPVMIGEPSGSSPNMFLTAEKTILPHSKIEFEVSTETFTVTEEKDNRTFIAPDIPAYISFEDYSHGHDPLIEIAKTINKDLREKLYGKHYDKPWKRASQRVTFR